MKQKVIFAGAIGLGAFVYQKVIVKTTDDLFYEECENVLKERLTAPSSYARTKEPFVYITEDAGDNIAQTLMRYDASNAFGVMVGGTAGCTFNLGNSEELPEGDCQFRRVRIDGTTTIEWHTKQASDILNSL